jgi:hypothetical protein
VRRSSRTSPRVIHCRLRETEAMALRLAGSTFEEIAASLGFRSRAGAFASITRALDRCQREPCPSLRKLEAERLDAMQQAIWPLAVGDPPDLPAVLAMLKLMERRARLLGLDTPSQVVATVVIDLEDLCRKIYGEGG